MTSVLVTGGAGFIGSNLVRRLSASSGYDITVLDALTYAGNLANIDELVQSGRIRFVKGDICDTDAVEALFAEHAITGVFHLAAESHVDRSILGPGEFVRTNVLGTSSLLQAAQAAWSGQAGRRLFVHVSTDEVFGSLGPDDTPFRETTAYRPNSPYSASKAASDHLVRAWRKTYDFPAVITNCSNNYGAWQFPEKLIPLMILNAVENKPLPVYGDGQQVRDWLHVEDHCDALIRVFERGTPGQTYCIGGDNERPNLEIVHRVCAAVDEATGRAAGSSESLIQHVTDRPGHDRRYAVDAGRIRASLGWEPQRSFDESLPGIVDWYVANRDWSEAIRDGSYLTYYERQYAGRLQS